MKNVMLNRLSTLCDDLPILCKLWRLASPALIVGVLLYLFITQEILS